MTGHNPVAVSNVAGGDARGFGLCHRWIDEWTAMDVAGEVGVVLGGRPRARHGSIYWISWIGSTPARTVCKEPIHLPHVVGPKVCSDLLHPSIGHCSVKRVATIDPCSIDRCLYAA